MSSIKVTNNGVTRRIPVDDTSSWKGIIERLSDVFMLDTESPELTYVDRDNDVITLSTITELQEAINDDIKTFCLSSRVSKIIFFIIKSIKSEFTFSMYTHDTMCLI